MCILEMSSATFIVSPALAVEREEPDEDRDTLEEERLEPPPYEERPALDDEDRETEDELRLEDDDEACPPPPRDWA